jgi:hypothetical protein
MEKLTQKRLKEVLHYDPETGMFTRKTNCGGAKIGDIAGCINDIGYITISIDYKKQHAHRLAFLYMEGYLPEDDVDHINRIRNDNRWENLRHVSKSCNSRNLGISKHNKSGITGVYWNGSKWCSQICIKNKTKALGTFENKTDAAQARWEAEVEYGFPNCNSTSTAYQYLQGGA